jgi:PAS domain S-box-containing protein
MQAAMTRTAQAYLEAMVDSAPLALALTDRDLRFIRHSPRWMTELGLDGRDIIGKRIYELFPGAEAQFGDAYQEALQGRSLSADALWTDVIDGRRLCLRCEVAPWRRPDDEVGGLFISVHDLTQMQQALERSERAERRLKIATEIANLHVFEADYVQGVMVSEGAEDTFFEQSLTFEQLRADPFCGVHPDDRERVAGEFMTAVASGQPYRSEYRVARSDGTEVWASSAIEVEADAEGNPISVLGTLRNITLRKRAELDLVRARDLAETANRAKSEFLATISHEIRTPLNGVLGMAQAMEADELSPRQLERLNVLRRSGEILLTLLNDVLDLAKIEAGKVELEEEPFDLEQVCAGAASGHTMAANRKGVSFSFQITDDALGFFRGDVTRIRQILQNLLSNAVKFTESGVVALAVSNEDGEVRLRVTDTGIGIPSDKIDHLFDKFVQADTSTTRRFGGSGLGLAITRDLVGLMGGDLRVESRAGEGSAFEVRLPLEPVAAPAGEAPAPAVVRSSAPAASLPTLRILAADDNEVNQLVLRTLLNQAGIEPTLVASGSDAVEAWAAGDWDLILMDIHMPDMDGVTAASLIRDGEARTARARTPIVALTANALKHQTAEYLAAGMDDVIAKPIQVSRLYEVIERMLSDDPVRAQASL